MAGPSRDGLIWEEWQALSRETRWVERTTVLLQEKSVRANNLNPLYAIAMKKYARIAAIPPTPQDQH